MNMQLRQEYPVEAGDFVRAGEASADIKRKLKYLGVPGAVLRRVAVASYEAEINLVIHSQGGVLLLEMDGTQVCLTSSDRGPGIADVALAMQEGYSTAGEEARNMGFGAGMGLPNMRRNADSFHIRSAEGCGTVIRMAFDLQGSLREG